MTGNAVAFKFMEEGEHINVGSKWIPCHMIFDVKSNLICSQGTLDRCTSSNDVFISCHPWKCSNSISNSSESVWIAFLIVALYGLEVLSADTGNAYLQAPAWELVHATTGPKFGPSHQGQTVIIIRAMYGLKSSGAAWHTQLSETLYSMNFKPTLVDPNVWFQAAYKDNGFDHYEYLLVYVDDILAISHQPHVIVETICSA